MNFPPKVSIEDFWRAMQRFQEEKNTFQSVREQQQMAVNPTIPSASTHLPAKESQITLPDKFEGIRSKF